MAKIKLGVVTDTWDREGKIVETKEVDKLNLSKVSEAIANFVGKYKQTPPVYSAIKYQGKPVYHYVRKGQKISLEPRLVRINSISILSLRDNILTIRVSCSSGTYIRSLAYEIGKKLGYGATLDRLVRTKIGDFDLEDGINLEDFINIKDEVDSFEHKSYLLGLERLLECKPDIYIKNKFKKQIINGQAVFGFMLEYNRTDADKIIKKDELVKIRDLEGNLLAVHKVAGEIDLKTILNGGVNKIKLTKNIVICQ